MGFASSVLAHIVITIYQSPSMVKPVIENPDYTIIIRAILLGRFSNRMLVIKNEKSDGRRLSRERDNMRLLG